MGSWKPFLEIYKKVETHLSGWSSTDEHNYAAVKFEFDLSTLVCCQCSIQVGLSQRIPRSLSKWEWKMSGLSLRSSKEERWITKAIIQWFGTSIASYCRAPPVQTSQSWHSLECPAIEF